MINTKLLNGVASLLGGSTFSIPSYLAFGSTTGTLTSGDVITSGEFDRNILDSKIVTDNTVKFYGSRISTEANNEYINIISMTNSATLNGSNDIMSNFLLPSLLHTTSFDINVEVWLEVNSE